MLQEDLLNSVTITGEPVSSAILTAGKMGMALYNENEELNRMTNKDSPLKTLEDELRKKRNLRTALNFVGPIPAVAGALLEKRARTNLKQEQNNILSSASSLPKFKKGGVVKAENGFVSPDFDLETDKGVGPDKNKSGIKSVGMDDALAYGQLGIGLLGSLTSGDAPDLGAATAETKQAYQRMLERENLPGLTPMQYNEGMKDIIAQRAAIAKDSEDFNLRLASSISSETAKLKLIEMDNQMKLARQEAGDKVRLDLANIAEKSKQAKYAEWMQDQEANAALINAGIKNISDRKFYEKLLAK